MDNGNPISPIIEEFDLLERHISILKTVRDNQPIGLIRLSESTGIPKHKIRYSLKLLEQQGIIRATSDGAVVTDRYDEFMDSVKTGINTIIDEVERVRTIL